MNSCSVSPSHCPCLPSVLIYSMAIIICAMKTSYGQMIRSRVRHGACQQWAMRFLPEYMSKAESYIDVDPCCFSHANGNNTNRRNRWTLSVQALRCVQFRIWMRELQHDKIIPSRDFTTLNITKNWFHCRLDTFREHCILPNSPSGHRKYVTL